MGKFSVLVLITICILSSWSKFPRIVFAHGTSEIESCAVQTVSRFPTVPSRLQQQQPPASSLSLAADTQIQTHQIHSKRRSNNNENGNGYSHEQQSGNGSGNQDSRSQNVPQSTSTSSKEEMLICQIRTLHSDLDFVNLTLTSSVPRQPDAIIKLKLICNDLLFFESILQSGQLSPFTNLQELSIEQCKLKHFSQQSLVGLKSLQKLRIITGNSDWPARTLEISPLAFESVGSSLRHLHLGFNNMWAVPNGFLCQVRNLHTLNLTHNLLSNINDLGLPHEFLTSSMSASASAARGAGAGAPTTNFSTFRFQSESLEQVESRIQNRIHLDGSSCGSDLKSLDLSFNSLQNLGSNKLETMRKLELFRLDHNWLEDIQPGAFHGLDQLRTLNLSSNRLNSLPTNLFQPSRHLRELHLKNNSLTELSPGLLHNLEHLTILDVSMNSLTGFGTTTGIFQGLYRLVILNLAENQLTNLTSSTFNDLYALQVLDLSENLISSIENGTFSTLSNLHALNLAHNRLTQIYTNTFNGLLVLHKLLMDYNDISSVSPLAFVNMTSLQDLGLVRNDLTEVPVAIQSLRSLQTLDLGENKIASVSNETFQGLSQLYGLRLVGNELEEIPKGFCQFIRRLRALNLAQNRIRKISLPTFGSCSDLRVLRLDSNRLEIFSPSFPMELPSLLWLNVSGNAIRWLEYSTLPPTLEWLDVSYNQLESLWGAASSSSPFSPISPVSSASQNSQPSQVPADQNTHYNNINTNSNSNGRNENHLQAGTGMVHNGHSTTNHHNHHRKFSRLRVLDASHNDLTQIDHQSIPTTLEVLRLSHNRISRISPDTFSTAANLRRVELVSNRLSRVQLKALRLAPPPTPTHPDNNNNNNNNSKRRPLVEFFLAGNPFLCDCDMEWLTRVNQLSSLRSHPFVTDMDSIQCQLPFDRVTTSKSLAEMKPQDFLCSYETHCFALCHCCEFDACDCQMTCPSGCSCYHDDTWSANVVNCAMGNHSTIPSRLPMDSTEVYLDGNPIEKLKSHSFIGRKNMRILYLNSSQIHTIANKSFNGLQSLQQLHLENNKLTALHGYEFDHLTRLRELYLNDNQIRTINNNTFLPLTSLEVLSVAGNLIVTFKVWQLNLNRNLMSVSLSRNSWDCECEFLRYMHNWLEENKQKIVDMSQVRCLWNRTRTNGGGGGGGSTTALGPYVRDYNLTCVSSWALIQNGILPFNLNFYWVITIGLVVILILSCYVGIMCGFSEEVKYGIYRYFGIRISSSFCCLCCCCHRGCQNWSSSHKAEDDGSEKIRDAYFIYSRADEEFVTKRIVDELEDNGGYHLLLHHRDCEKSRLPTTTMTGTGTGSETSSTSHLREMMRAAIGSSRALVLVISQNFLQIEWMNREFREALLGALDGEKSRKSPDARFTRTHKSTLFKSAIVILKDDTTPLVKINSDPDFLTFLNLNRRQVKRRTVRWSEDTRTFWNKLKFLLPEPPRRRRRTKMDLPCHSSSDSYTYSHTYNSQRSCSTIVPHNIKLNCQSNIILTSESELDPSVMSMSMPVSAKAIAAGASGTEEPLTTIGAELTSTPKKLLSPYSPQRMTPMSTSSRNQRNNAPSNYSNEFQGVSPQFSKHWTGNGHQCLGGVDGSCSGSKLWPYAATMVAPNPNLALNPPYYNNYSANFSPQHLKFPSALAVDPSLQSAASSSYSPSNNGIGPPCVGIQPPPHFQEILRNGNFNSNNYFSSPTTASHPHPRPFNFHFHSNNYGSTNRICYNGNGKYGNLSESSSGSGNCSRNASPPSSNATESTIDININTDIKSGSDLIPNLDTDVQVQLQGQCRSGSSSNSSSNSNQDCKCKFSNARLCKFRCGRNCNYNFTAISSQVDDHDDDDPSIQDDLEHVYDYGGNFQTSEDADSQQGYNNVAVDRMNQLSQFPSVSGDPKKSEMEMEIEEHVYFTLDSPSSPNENDGSLPINPSSLVKTLTITTTPSISSSTSVSSSHGTEQLPGSKYLHHHNDGNNFKNLKTKQCVQNGDGENSHEKSKSNEFPYSDRTVHGLKEATKERLDRIDETKMQTFLV